MQFSLVGTLAAAVFCGGCLLGLVAFWDLQRFLRRVEMLRTAEDLATYQRMAGRQMYLAISGIGLDVVALVMVLVGMALSALEWDDLLLVGPILLAFLLLYGPIRAAERTAQQLPVMDAAMHAARERVVQTWKWKVFPDW